MKCNPIFIETIPQILTDHDLRLLNDRLNGHLNDELWHTSFNEFIELCRLIQPLVLHESDSYTFRRVIVGFNSDDVYCDSSYDLNNISKGLISVGSRKYQSWTTKKSISSILWDRYESITRQNNETIMYMIEKTFPKENILMHIPSLVCALGNLGFKDLYDGFFDKGGLYTEDEVIIEAPQEIEYENLWFFELKKKSYNSIIYKKESGIVKIPLVDGGYSESNMIYF